jgi:hypothetical protein
LGVPSELRLQRASILITMRAIFIPLVLAVTLLSAYATVPAISGPVYNPANGHTYYLLNSDTWFNSESAAVSLGGHLVTVNDAAENSFLLTTFSNYGGQPRSLWTGLNDFALEGSFVWSSGQTAAYRNWEGGEPDDGGGFYPTEDFVHIWPSPGPRSPGQWNDYIDSATFPDISFAIYGVVEIPEPSVLVMGMLGLGFLVNRLGRSK